MEKLDLGKIADRYMPAPLRYYWDNRGTSPVGYRIAHGAFWSMIGTGFPQAINMITLIIIARFLGKEHFGELGMITSTASVFSMFAVFGLAMASTKHVAAFKNSDPAKAGRIIALFSLLAAVASFLMAGVLFVAAPWLASRTLAAPHLTDLLRISAGLIFFSAFNSVQMGTLTGFEAFRAIALINSIFALISLPLIAGGLYFSGLPGAVWGMVISMSIFCALSSIELRNEARQARVPIALAGCGRELYILLEFSLPAVLASFVYTSANWICAAMLVNQPNGYAEMGIFNAANSWQKFILFLPQCLNTIALPMLSDYQGTRQSRQYRKAFWYNIILIGMSALSVAVVVALASPYIMKAYGAGFSSGSCVLMLISFITALIAIDTFIGITLITKGRVWFGFFSNSLWASILITSAYFVLPLYGASGLCFSLLIAYILQTAWLILYNYKK